MERGTLISKAMEIKFRWPLKVFRVGLSHKYVHLCCLRTRRAHRPEARAVPKVTAKPHAVTFGYLTPIMVGRIKIIPPNYIGGNLNIKFSILTVPQPGNTELFRPQ